MKKAWIFIGMVILGIIALIAVREVFRPSSSLAGKRADYTLTASRLASEFEQDEAGGNEKYLGKILRVSGEIHEIEGGTPLTVVLKGEGMAHVRVELTDPPESLPQPGENIEVIGSCSGFLLDVVLNNAALLNN